MDRYKYDTEVQVWRYAAAKYYNEHHPNSPIDLSQFDSPPLPDTFGGGEQSISGLGFGMLFGLGFGILNVL